MENKNKIVIAGSTSLGENIFKKWVDFWSVKGEVINYPAPIGEDINFADLWAPVHKKFFKDLTEADILFVANEEKNGIDGYIGYETYAELTFAVIQKTVYNKNIKIILAKMPSEQVKCRQEIEGYLKLGWVELLK